MRYPFWKYSLNSRRMSRDIIILSETLSRACREKEKEGRKELLPKLIHEHALSGIKSKKYNGILMYLKKMLE